MKTYRSITTLLLVCLSIFLVACGLLNSQEKIENLQGTIQAMSTQIGKPADEGQVKTTEPPVIIEQGSGSIGATEVPASGGGLELINQYGGSAVAVAVRGDHAYLGQGPRLVVLDIADPANPQFVTQSEVLPGIVRGVDVDDRYVYVTTQYGGLNVFEFQQPGKLTRLGSVEPDRPGCGSMELKDKIAYVACNPGGLFIVDVTDPAAPNILSDGAVSGVFVSIALVGKHAYLADALKGGLVIADIRDPLNPRQVGGFDVNQIPGDNTKMIAAVEGCGDNLCVAVQHYGLGVLSLQDPQTPVYLAGDSPYWPSGIVVDGQYAYLLGDGTGVMIYDISKPLQPQRVGLLATSVGGLEFGVSEPIERGIFVADGWLYIPDQRIGLVIVDVRDPAAPRLEGRYMTPLPDWLWDIKVRDDYAYVISRSGGFRIVEIVDSANLQEVFYDDEPKNVFLQNPIALEIIDHYALITDANYPLHAYDIADPRKARQVSQLYTHDAPDGATDMVIAGNYAYLSGWGGKNAFFPGKGIWVVDISRPDALAAVDFVDLPNGRWSLALHGSTLYALDGEIDRGQAEPFSLRVLDISDGAKPSVVKSIPIPELQMMSPSDLLVTGNELYLSTGMTGLKRYDITSPQTPVELPMDNTLFPYAFQLHAEPPYLVVNGNQVWDISNPGSPEIIGFPVVVLEAWACDIVENLLFVATRLHGVYVYRITGR